MIQKKESEYIQVENDLKNALNGRLNKQNAEVVYNSIKILKQDFNIRISTKFLRGLIDLTLDNRKKTYKISYFLKKCGLKTKREIKFNIPEWVFNTFYVEVVDYDLTDEGQIKIKEIRNQDIGKEFIQNKAEVFHFVEI